MSELTDLYARDYEDSILQGVRDNPFFKVGMHVLVSGNMMGIVTEHEGFCNFVFAHFYTIEYFNGQRASMVSENMMQRITERKLVLVKS